MVCYETSQTIDKYIYIYIFISFDWNISPLSTHHILFTHQNPWKVVNDQKEPCLVSFSRCIMEVKLFVRVEQCHASSTINRMRYMYVYDNETFIQLSHNERHIIIQTKISETDKMLKRAYNPFIEIRRVTRHIIEEIKLAVCSCWSFIFFLFLVLTLFHWMSK